MRNAELDEAQAGFNIAGRSINNLRNADDTTLMSESEEELKSLLMKVKDKGEKSWLETQHSKNEDHGIRSHHFMANRWGTMETVTDFIFLAPNSLQMVTAAMKLKDTCSLEQKLWQTSLSLLVAKSCPTLATPWTDCQAPLSMGFSRQEYWGGLPFPSPEDLPNPGIEPRSPALRADSLPTELWRKPMTNLDNVLKKQRQYFSNKAPSSRSYDFFQ